MSIRADAAPRRCRDAFVHRNVAGEALLIPIRRQPSDLQAAYLLNETAEFLYRNLDGARTPGDLARLLAERFEVDPDRAGRDTRGLLAELVGIGAVEWERV
jgi:hypothetical protein